jgi:hypothetical protein
MMPEWWEATGTIGIAFDPPREDYGALDAPMRLQQRQVTSPE